MRAHRPNLELGDRKTDHVHQQSGLPLIYMPSLGICQLLHEVHEVALCQAGCFEGPSLLSWPFYRLRQMSTSLEVCGFNLASPCMKAQSESRYILGC
jgi:hypothetical protein